MNAPEFGKSERPWQQWPIQAPKATKIQQCWIVASYADRDFALAIVGLDGSTPPITTEPRPYSDFWRTLAELDLDKRKWWLIAHRTRYAIEQAGFLQALERGEIKLPSSRKKNGENSRSGKLAFGINCLEIDLVAGRNRIKLLDWKNYGIEPPGGDAEASFATIMNAHVQLRDFQHMCKETDIALTKTTAAQLGWQHARVNHAPTVLMYNLHQESRELERRAYHSGRNEPFRLGEIPDAVISLDVKSCYAATCYHKFLPVYQQEFYPLGMNADAIDYKSGDHYIADVVIETPSADYPVRHQGTTIYPTGQFFTTLCWPELAHALAKGRVSKIIRAARYATSRAFRKYAFWYLECRDMTDQSGLSPMAPALKAIFNGSLGYTARQKYELKPWFADCDRDWWFGHTSAPDHSAPIVQAQVLDGVKEWLKIGGEPREAMPFLHATICSWARVNLLDIFAWAGRDWIYYCDTDGVLVDYRGYANLLDSPGLIGNLPGQLSERWKSGPCTINGQKNYRLGDNVVCAGLVRTRHSEWAAKTVLSTPTGQSSAEGIVTPFEMRCKDVGDEEPKYANEIA